jgi:hypothetical protein
MRTEDSYDIQGVLWIIVASLNTGTVFGFFSYLLAMSFFIGAIYLTVTEHRDGN